jgi:hypothetical protein
MKDNCTDNMKADGLSVKTMYMWTVEFVYTDMHTLFILQIRFCVIYNLS